MEEVSGSQSNQTQPYLKGVISVNMCTKFEVEWSTTMVWFNWYWDRWTKNM